MSPMPVFPRVRQAFGMDINAQEFCQAVGLSLPEIFCPDVFRGVWSNNWVLYSRQDTE